MNKQLIDQLVETIKLISYNPEELTLILKMENKQKMYIELLQFYKKNSAKTGIRAEKIISERYKGYFKD